MGEERELREEQQLSKSRHPIVDILLDSWKSASVPD